MIVGAVIGAVVFVMGIVIVIVCQRGQRQPVIPPTANPALDQPSSAKASPAVNWNPSDAEQNRTAEQPMYAEPGSAYAELDGQQNTYRTSALRAAQLDYGIITTTSAARVADSASRPPTSGPEVQHAAVDYFEIADPIVDATYEAPCEDVDAQRMIGELKVLTVILKFARGSTVKQPVL